MATDNRHVRTLASILAHMVPATAGPAGSSEVAGVKMNYDMPNMFETGPWPRKDGVWWHRDHRRPAYVYVYKPYDQIVNSMLQVDQ